MLLRGETNFFARTLRHYSVLIFNFSDIKCGRKIKIKELHHKSLVKIQEIKEFQIIKKNIYNYGIIAQKLPMLKQGLTTINAEFI